MDIGCLFEEWDLPSSPNNNEGLKVDRPESVALMNIGCLFEESDRPSPPPSFVDDYEEASYISETESEEYDSGFKSDELELEPNDESLVKESHTIDHSDNIKKRPTAIEIQKNLDDFIRIFTTSLIGIAGVLSVPPTQSTSSFSPLLSMEFKTVDVASFLGMKNILSVNFAEVPPVVPDVIPHQPKIERSDFSTIGRRISAGLRKLYCCCQ